MAEQLKEIIAYILEKYPHKTELSNARVTKIIYLADWHQAINFNKQISNINWYFDNYGPYVSDIKDEVANNPSLFNTIDTVNHYSQKKLVFKLTEDDYKATLTKESQESINYIINITKSMNWDDFINLVYSTYPIVSSNRYSYLNLLEKAKKYKYLSNQ